MKNSIKYFILAFLISFLQLGCSESFLDQPNLDGMNEEVLFNVPQDAVAAVNGVYDLLHNDHIDYVIKGIWYNAAFLSQDVHNWGADIFYELYQIPVTFSSCNKFWEVNYIGIARANQVLNILDGMMEKGILEEAEGNRLKGECLFLRGFFYTELASNFGEVPLILEPSKDGREPQATQDEIFTQVAVDMMAAADYLPWSYDAENVGRATKAAALAYAGEAYMWLKNYSQAEIELQKIYDFAQSNPNVIGLLDSYWNVHELEYENSKESLFAIQYITPAQRNWNRGDDCQWMQNFCMPDEVNGTGYAYCDKNYYDCFEAGDTRKVASVIGPGDEHPTCPINSYPKIQNLDPSSPDYGVTTCGTVAVPWDRVGRSGYYSMKFWRLPASVIDGSSGPMFSELNLIMMRYAQVILDLAECKWRNSKNAEAMALVMKVRDRAWGGVGIAPSPVDTDMEDIIVHEYRTELSGEFSFWFILRRMGIATAWVLEEHGITVPPGREVIPIPQQQIDVNDNLHQTSGYLTN